MTTTTILTILTTLLGGSNLLTILMFFAEKRKRKADTSISEAEALEIMRKQYAQFLLDDKKRYDDLMAQLTAVKREFREWKEHCKSCKTPHHGN